MLRSAVAILAGFTLIATLSFATDAVVRTLAPSAFDAAGRTDSVLILLLAMGYVAAWTAAPAWYHLASLALVLPYAWLGGRLREWELARAAAPVR